MVSTMASYRSSSSRCTDSSDMVPRRLLLLFAEVEDLGGERIAEADDREFEPLDRDLRGGVKSCLVLADDARFDLVCRSRLADDFAASAMFVQPSMEVPLPSLSDLRRTSLADLFSVDVRRSNAAIGRTRS